MQINTQTWCHQTLTPKPAATTPNQPPSHLSPEAISSSDTKLDVEISNPNCKTRNPSPLYSSFNYVAVSQTNGLAKVPLTPWHSNDQWNTHINPCSNLQFLKRSSMKLQKSVILIKVANCPKLWAFLQLTILNIQMLKDQRNHLTKIGMHKNWLFSLLHLKNKTVSS